MVIYLAGNQLRDPDSLQRGAVGRSINFFENVFIALFTLRNIPALTLGDLKSPNSPLDLAMERKNGVGEQNRRKCLEDPWTNHP